MQPEAIQPRILRVILAAALACSAGLLLCAVLHLMDQERIAFIQNILEITFGAGGGTLLILFARKAGRFYITATALAIFSWTLGQIFWFSYTSITGDALPYPSVGDIGYTGTYLLLFGAAGLITGDGCVQKRPWRFASLIIFAAPVVLLLAAKSKPEALFYNFVLSTATAAALFRVLPLLRFRNYRVFALGVVMLGIADFTFMMSVGLFPQGGAVVSDALYTVSIAVIAYGMSKGGVSSDD